MYSTCFVNTSQESRRKAKENETWSVDSEFWGGEGGEDEELFRLPDHLFLYIGAAVFVCGLLGNTLIFVVVAKTKSAKTLKTRLHIQLLAACDLLTLLFGLLRRWLQLAASVDVAALRLAWCKVVAFTTYYSAHLSAWIIACMTLERFAAVYFPLTANAKSHQRVNMYILGGLSASLFLLDLHVLFPAVVQDEGSDANEADMACVLTGPHWYHKLWSSIDFILYTGFPCIITLVLNVMIIRQIRKSRSAEASEMATTTDDRGTAPLTRNQRSFKPSSHHGLKIRTQQKITKTLLCVSFCYMIFTIPHVLCVQIQNFLEECDSIVLSSFAYDVIHASTELLMYAHHAAQFYIYFFSGQRFRNATLRIVRNRGFTARSNPQCHIDMPLRRPKSANAKPGNKADTWAGPSTLRLIKEAHGQGASNEIERDDQSSSPSIRLRTAMSISVVETCAKTYKMKLPIRHDSQCVFKCGATVLTHCNSYRAL